MAKFRRSKTNCTFFMDIPKSRCSRKWKSNTPDEIKAEGNIEKKIIYNPFVLET